MLTFMLHAEYTVVTGAGRFDKVLKKVFDFEKIIWIDQRKYIAPDPVFRSIASIPGAAGLSYMAIPLTSSSVMASLLFSIKARKTIITFAQRIFRVFALGNIMIINDNRLHTGFSQ